MDNVENGILWKFMNKELQNWKISQIVYCSEYLLVGHITHKQSWNNAFISWQKRKKIKIIKRGMNTFGDYGTYI